MHLHRTIFKNEIICEFLPPQRPSNNVIILCDGMPTMPSKKHVIEFYSQKNFWVFHPRYRGSWESSGEFLSNEPTQDIFDIINQLPKGFTSIWLNKKFKVN